eukprot:43226-Chlamydomonas_euryale.AAC.1
MDARAHGRACCAWMRGGATGRMDAGRGNRAHAACDLHERMAAWHSGHVATWARSQIRAALGCVMPATAATRHALLWCGHCDHTPCTVMPLRSHAPHSTARCDRKPRTPPHSACRQRARHRERPRAGNAQRRLHPRIGPSARRRKPPRRRGCSGARGVRRARGRTLIAARHAGPASFVPRRRAARAPGHCRGRWMGASGQLRDAARRGHQLARGARQRAVRCGTARGVGLWEGCKMWRELRGGKRMRDTFKREAAKGGERLYPPSA